MSVGAWIIVRSGNLQTAASPGSGCVRLFEDLNARFASRTVRVELEAWKDDPETTAAFVDRLSSDLDPPKIVLIGYSWGAGYGCVRLAKALRTRGLQVDAAVLCDPVYHSRVLWWRALLARTLFRPVTITIPSNVAEVHWLRQHVDRPAGHDLVAQAPKRTTIHDPQVLDVGHLAIDDTREFHSLALRTVQDVLSGESPRLLKFPYAEDGPCAPAR